MKKINSTWIHFIFNLGEILQLEIRLYTLQPEQMINKPKRVVYTFSSESSFKLYSCKYCGYQFIHTLVSNFARTGVTANRVRTFGIAMATVSIICCTFVYIGASFTVTKETDFTAAIVTTSLVDTIGIDVTFVRPVTAFVAST